MQNRILAGDFSYFEAPITRTVPKYNCYNLDLLYEHLRNTSCGPTDVLRSLKDKKKASEFKKQNFDYATFSGVFETRSDKALVNHSNLICLDIDGITDPESLKQRLANDPYIALMFTSPSNNGLKIVFGMDIGRYKQLEWYKALTNYLHEQHGIEKGVIDSSCSNVSRACFLPFDHSPYINSNWREGIPLIDGIFFQEYCKDQNLKTSYEPDESCESYEIEEDLDFADRNSEQNFLSLVARNVGSVGDFRSPRQPWLHKLACRCNLFGMNEDVTIKFLRKHFEFHPAATDPAKPMDVENYIVATTNDVYKRYAEDFATWKPKLKAKVFNLHGEPIADEVFLNLPPVLSEIVKDLTDHERSLTFLSSLTVLSGALPGVYGKYDGQTIYPNIMTFVTANAASGKGKAVFGMKLGKGIANYLKEQNDLEQEQYIENLKNHQEGKLEEKPKEPKSKVFFLPANTSTTAVYSALLSNPDGLVMFETEADTLMSAMGNDWGNYSDLLRKAYHNEPASILRVESGKSGFSEKTNISVFLAGTPNQFFKMFPDAENGLLSRFLIYPFEGSTEWKDVFEPNDTGLESTVERLAEDVKDIYKICLLKKGVIPEFQFTDEQKGRFKDEFSQFLRQYQLTHGPSIVASIKRLGSTMFKIAMILSAIRSAKLVLDNKWDGICTDDDFSTALGIIKSLVPNTANIIRLLPKNGPSNSKMSASVIKYFDNLPDVFNKRLAEGVAKAINLNLKTAEAYRYRLVDSKLLIKLEHNLYQKVA